MSEQRKKEYLPQIGTFFKRTDRETGELLKDEKGNQLYSFSLNKDVKISINGKEYTEKYFYVNRPYEKLERLLKAGKLTEEEYESKISRFEEGGDLSNLVFEINPVNK